jgi:excisionase family DNA binding protein
VDTSDTSKAAASTAGSALERLRHQTTCSIDEAALVLGIGRSTAYAAAREGSLPVLKIRNRLLVPTAKLLALLGVEQGE